MANTDVAIQFVLRQEDPLLSGEVTTLEGDSGGATRFGIASASHPELIPQGYFEASRVSTAAALVIAEHVYNESYAVPLQTAAIADQAIATAVLSLGINSGIERAAEELQLSCGALGHAVEVDSNIGPETIGVVNSITADQLLAAFSTQADGFYTELARNNANDRLFLHGWENRVAAWTANAAYLRAQA